MKKYNNKIERVPSIIKAAVLRNFASYNYLLIFGTLGFLKFKFRKITPVDIRFGKLRVAGVYPLFQTYLSIIRNMMRGVLSGHTSHLELRGVGYKFRLTQNCIYLIIGFSHIKKFKFQKNIKLKLLHNKNLTMFSYRNASLKSAVLRIKQVKAQPVYKNKGIFFKGEVVALKVGKKSNSF